MLCKAVPGIVNTIAFATVRNKNVIIVRLYFAALGYVIKLCFEPFINDQRFREYCILYHGGTPIWRLHSELYKFGWNGLANNSRTLYRTDLRLGEVVYLLILITFEILGFFY